ncbi:26.5 kDa heat shock protein, mitochondrial [Telopea speciosissima]|uniref:26.5 kDa heat shock protein, mitochondrial n=1 Tax=Telopea speciosissima TaxID=54955 RepID=UPI001CC4F8C7|nr:26.5 kDa heat shock protein, mitochondrial [Telopea speciosissima]
MAMARLALSNLQQRVSMSSLFNAQIGNRGMVVPQQKRWGSELLRRLSTTDSEKVSDEKSSQGRDIAVSEGGSSSSKKSKLSPFRRKKGSWRRGLWRNDNRDLIPFSLNELFPFPLGLENALLEATENLNKLFTNLSPSGLIGRIKEDDDAYRLQYQLPGLSKEDLNITIEDGFLVIKGEHKEEKEEENSSDDDDGSSANFRYYNTSILLPEDAKVDDIKAEMKDGVLTITIPKTEKPKKDVKEVQIH